MVELVVPPPLSMLVLEVTVPPVMFNVAWEVPDDACDPSVNAVFTVKLPPPTFKVPAASALPVEVLIPILSVSTVNVPASKERIPVTPPLLVLLLVPIDSVPDVTLAT